MEFIINMFKFLANQATNSLGTLIRGMIHKRDYGSRFMNEKEVSSFLSSSNKGLLLDGNNLRQNLKESYMHNLIVAKSGAGKTTKYIISNVLDKANSLSSLVVNDPKGEVHRLTSGYMKSKGFDVVVFNPDDFRNSHCFNPFHQDQNELEIEQDIETITWSGNPGAEAFWNNGASRIMSALAKILAAGDYKYFNLPNLYRLLQAFGDKGKGIEHWVLENGWYKNNPDDDYLIREWQAAITGNSEGVSSFIMNALTALRMLSNRDIRAFFSHNSYDLRKLRKRKTIIYFITPASRQRYYSFITSIFFRKIFTECMRDEHLRGNSLPVHILYDEFGNSYVSDFSSIANTIRGYNVSLSIILQSISQLEERYGKGEDKTILGAFNTQLCYDSCDHITASYFSNLCGVKNDWKEKDRNKDNNLLDDRMDLQQYNLINADGVRRIAEDEVLIVSRNRYPLLTKVTPYYTNRRFRNNAKYPPFSVKREGKITLHVVNTDKD